MPNLLGSNAQIPAKLLKFPDWVQIKVNQADGAMSHEFLAALEV